MKKIFALALLLMVFVLPALARTKHSGHHPINHQHSNHRQHHRQEHHGHRA
jgi:hypothetical protein